MGEELKGRENPGWFRRGEDERRHRFTVDECVAGGVKGFRRCLERWPELYGYLMARALHSGRARSRRARAGEGPCSRAK